MLLRADIHTLLYLRLLAPDPATGTIVISSCSSELSTRHSLPANSLTLQQQDKRSAPAALEVIWQDFRAAEDDR